MASYDRSSTQKASVWDGGQPILLSNSGISTVVTDGDVIRALTIPKGYYVGNVFVDIEVQSDDAVGITALVGDTTDPNGWDDAIDLAAVAGTRTQGAAGTDAYVPTGAVGFPGDAKAYPNGGAVDLTVTVGGSPTVGSIKVSALCYKPLLASY
jgi:hypothetical protein